MSRPTREITREKLKQYLSQRACRLARYYSLFTERLCSCCSKPFVRLLSWRWQPRHEVFKLVGLRGGFICGRCAKSRGEAESALLHLWELYAKDLAEQIDSEETGTVIVPPPARPPLRPGRSSSLLN